MVAHITRNVSEGF